METWKRWLCFVIGYLESLLFAGIIYGWPSLVYLFKKDHLYSHLCSNITVKVKSFNDSTISQKVTITEKIEVTSATCYEEDSMYNLAFSLGTCILSSSVLFAAFILDYIGLRTTRIINSILLAVGFFLLGMCDKERPYFILYGVVLLGLGGGQLRLTDLQIADIFPKTKATVIALYSGAYTGSSIVFLFFKIAYEFGISWHTSFYFCSILSLLMLIPTFFLFPKNKFGTEKQKIIRNMQNGSHVDEKSALIVRSESKCDKEPHTQHQISVDKSIEYMKSLPLFSSLTSFSYIIHVYSISISCLVVMVFNGSFNVWISNVTNNHETVSDLVELFGSVQILMVVIGPLVGTMMDYAVNKANAVKEPIERRKKRQKAGFWALMVTFAVIIALLSCTFFGSINAVYVSIFIYLLCRSMSISAQPAYIRVRFPQHHFNVLTGISGVAIGFQALIQYFIFIWMGNSPFLARSTLFILSSLNFISPLHLLCLPVIQNYS